MLKVSANEESPTGSLANLERTNSPGIPFRIPFVAPPSRRHSASNKPARRRRYIALFILLVVASCNQKQITQAKLPVKNLLLITIDTLRPDALSIYGSHTRTPFFEQFAHQAIVFDHALTCAPITLPSHTSLLTGLYPPHHGVRNNGTFRAPERLILLSEYAKQNHLATAAIIGGFPLASQFGLNQGFDYYDDEFADRSEQPGSFSYAEKSAEKVVVSAENWLSKLRPGSNYFLWVHFFDPHHPYLTHGMPDLNPYEQEVVYVDQQLQKFFQFLKQRNLDQNTMMIVTADHGEAFGEHKEVSHSLFVYNVTLRIPLLISYPGVQASRRAALVRTVDILPTIMQMFHWKENGKVDGISLVPVLNGKDLSPQESYAETFAPALDFGWSPLLSIQDLHGKFIQAPKPEFYDLGEDPAETKNLAGSTDTSKYRSAIGAITRVNHPTENYTPTAEEREQLESLGYFSGVARKQRENAPDPKDMVQIARKIAELTMNPSSLQEKAAAYQQLIMQDSDNPLLLLRYAEILLEQQEYSKAEKVYQHVFDLEYPSPSVYNGMATVYFYQNQPEKAEKILKQAVDLKIADGETYYNLAEFLFDHGDHETAIRYYQRSMELGFLQGFYRLARIHEITGDYSGAMEILRRAEEKAPARFEVNYERGMIYFRHNQLPAALSEFQKGRAKAPEQPLFTYTIGLVYFRMNDVVNTRKYMQEFLRKAPTQLKDQRQAAELILKRK